MTWQRRHFAPEQNGALLLHLLEKKFPEELSI